MSFAAVYLLQPWTPYPLTGWTARHWGLSIPWMIEVFKEPSKCATLICVSSNSELIQYRLRDIQSTARPLILWISAKRERSFDFPSGLLSALEKKNILWFVNNTVQYSIQMDLLTSCQELIILIFLPGPWKSHWIFTEWNLLSQNNNQSCQTCVLYFSTSEGIYCSVAF